MEQETIRELDSIEVLRNEGSISLLAKAEIDTQIATAKAFPRSIKMFINRAISIATVTEEVADACAYVLPRGKNKDGSDKFVEGPSVRLAEIVIGAYGNVRAAMRVVYNDGKKITAQGICHDLETNTCVTLDVNRSILQHIWEPDPNRPGKMRKSGRMEMMTEDMQVVTGNAACAIAFRNAVYKIIPSALIQPIYEMAKQVAKGTAETLPARRLKALDYLHALGVTDEQICIALQLQAVDDIDLDKLAILRGMCTAIKNQEERLDVIFPKVDKKPAEAAKKATDATTAALQAQQDKANAAAGRKTAAEKKAEKKTMEGAPGDQDNKIQPK